MAPRRRGGKKASKPTMAKAKKMVTKLHKAKAKKNMDTFFLKARTTVTLTPTQGVLAANYIYQAYTLDPNNAGSTALYLNNAEFNLYKLQYDKFRVNSVKVTVTPKANVLDQYNAQNDVLNVSGDGLVHTCIDRDGLATSSKAVISRYPSYRKYSILKTFSRTYSIKYPTGVWLDCQNIPSFSMAKELGLTGGVTMYADNLLEDNLEIINEPWATVVVEYNIVFQGKTSNSLKGVYDDNGNLVGVTINAIDQSATDLPLSLSTNIAGTLDGNTISDNSGNEVKVDDIGVPI